MKNFIVLFTALSVSAIANAGVVYDSESQTALVGVKSNDGLKVSLCSNVNPGSLNRNVEDLLKSETCQSLTPAPLNEAQVRKVMSEGTRKNIHALFDKARASIVDKDKWAGINVNEAPRIERELAALNVRLEGLASPSNLSYESTEELTSDINSLISSSK